MKKKLLGLIAAAVLLVPFTNVNAVNATDCALDQSCHVYTPGELVNFLVSQNQANQLAAGDLTVGQHTIILKDNGKADKYVEALSLSIYAKTIQFYDPDIELTPGQELKKGIIGAINVNGDKSFELVKRDADGVLDMRYPTVDEIKTLWGATFDQASNSYTIDMSKVDSTLIKHIQSIAAHASLPNFKNGFYTGTLTDAKDKVWVVKFQFNGETLSGMKMELVSSDTSDYAVVPVLYFDKNYDCKDRDNKEEYACYACGEVYKWFEKGKEENACTIILDITTKDKCVKNAKTGIEDYIVEFVGVTAICAVALVIAKKKELFKSI